MTYKKASNQNHRLILFPSIQQRNNLQQNYNSTCEKKTIWLRYSQPHSKRCVRIHEHIFLTNENNTERRIASLSIAWHLCSNQKKSSSSVWPRVHWLWLCRVKFFLSLPQFRNLSFMILNCITLALIHWLHIRAAIDIRPPPQPKEKEKVSWKSNFTRDELRIVFLPFECHLVDFPLHFF